MPYGHTQEDYERLQEIKARAENATPGPWPNPIYDPVGANSEGLGGWHFGYEDESYDAPENRWTDWASMERDAEFVAHAPSDVVWLVQKLEAATYELQQQRRLKQYYIDRHREAVNDNR